jgi:hypothetical protein
MSRVLHELLVLMVIVKSIIVLMFFVPYIIFQPPMTIVIRKFGPTIFLSSIIICWAAIMIVSPNVFNRMQLR